MMAAMLRKSSLMVPVDAEVMFAYQSLYYRGASRHSTLQAL